MSAGGDDLGASWRCRGQREWRRRGGRRVGGGTSRTSCHTSLKAASTMTPLLSATSIAPSTFSYPASCSTTSSLSSSQEGPWSTSYTSYVVGPILAKWTTLPNSGISGTCVSCIFLVTLLFARARPWWCADVHSGHQGKQQVLQQRPAPRSWRGLRRPGAVFTAPTLSRRSTPFSSYQFWTLWPRQCSTVNILPQLARSSTPTSERRISRIQVYRLHVKSSSSGNPYMLPLQSNRFLYNKAKNTAVKL